MIWKNFLGEIQKVKSIKIEKLEKLCFKFYMVKTHKIETDDKLRKYL